MKMVLANATLDDIINDGVEEIGIGDTVTVSNEKKCKTGKEAKALFKGNISREKNYPIKASHANNW